MVIDQIPENYSDHFEILVAQLVCPMMNMHTMIKGEIS